MTLQPIEAFDLDAAIIFADILPPLITMGLTLDFVKGEGPVIENAITSTRDIDLLATPPAEATILANTLEAIRLVVAELAPRNIPLIGFAGAPFTLASYAVEGGGSKSFARTKALMYGEPAAWRRLMDKLVTVQADYLLAQARAGASALQLFDSWAGLALGKEDYEQYVQPYNARLFQKLESAGVPVINFSTGTTAYLPSVAAAGTTSSVWTGGCRSTGPGSRSATIGHPGQPRSGGSAGAVARAGVRANRILEQAGGRRGISSTWATASPTRQSRTCGGWSILSTSGPNRWPARR